MPSGVYVHKKGIRHSEETKRKIGLKSRGRFFSIEARLKMSLAGKGKKKNENNPMWKGNDVGYTALHEYIKRRLPKPENCQICDIISRLDLACVTGIYERDLINWKYICRKCHMLSDGRMKNLRQFKNG